jgi:hypothetical protein
MGKAEEEYTYKNASSYIILLSRDEGKNCDEGCYITHLKDQKILPKCSRGEMARGEEKELVTRGIIGGFRTKGSRTSSLFDICSGKCQGAINSCKGLLALHVIEGLFGCPSSAKSQINYPSASLVVLRLCTLMLVSFKTPIFLC